jgi:hypothetical protein
MWRSARLAQRSSATDGGPAVAIGGAVPLPNRAPAGKWDHA